MPLSLTHKRENMRGVTAAITIIRRHGRALRRAAMIEALSRLASLPGVVGADAIHTIRQYDKARFAAGEIAKSMPPIT